MNSFFLLHRSWLDFKANDFKTNACLAFRRKFLGFFFSLSEQSDREINQGSAVLWDHLNEGEIKVLW